MNVQMKNKKGVIAVILSLLVITLVAIQPAPFSPFDRDIDPERHERRLALLPYYIKAKTILSTVNSILLLILLVTYVDIYRKTGSEFSLGLIIFSVALLLYSFSSNPLIHMFAGFKGSGLGPFTMLPDLFTCIAAATLLYISRQ